MTTMNGQKISVWLSLLLALVSTAGGFFGSYLSGQREKWEMQTKLSNCMEATAGHEADISHLEGEVAHINQRLYVLACRLFKECNIP